MKPYRLTSLAVSEHGEQVAFFAFVRPYLKTKGIDPRLCYAVPNAQILMRSARNPHAVMSYLRAEGFTDGVLDINFDYPRGDFNGLRIEMKRVGGKASPEQIEMASLLRAQGFNVVIAEGCDEAARAIRAYLGDVTARAVA